MPDQITTKPDARVIFGVIAGRLMLTVQRALDEGWRRSSGELTRPLAVVHDRSVEHSGVGVVTGKVMWMVGWDSRKETDGV